MTLKAPPAASKIWRLPCVTLAANASLFASLRKEVARPGTALASTADRGTYRAQLTSLNASLVQLQGDYRKVIALGIFMLVAAPNIIGVGVPKWTRFRIGLAWANAVGVVAGLVALSPDLNWVAEGLRPVLC
ncbi:hypothetical protein [Methylobacterium sp. CM6244]